MDYTSYRYIYPPRPENKISSESLKTFENFNIFMAQPKLNGSLMELYTDGSKFIAMNRHKEPLAQKIGETELKALHRGNGWMVLCGEYMNKSKQDEDKKIWNLKYVIFDIIVYNGKHLLNSTFEERFNLLKELYPDNPVKKHLHQISTNCFRVNSIVKDFKTCFDEITPHEMYEGLVLKKKNAPLENGFRVQNNVKSQIKCRKSTKNYNF